jgi:UDP-N-acetylglucosamine 1-carboxyvinyltransferase
MDSIRIEGGVPLKGTVRASGAKNAALPILAATLLTDNITLLKRIPNVQDVLSMRKLLKTLGLRVTDSEEGLYCEVIQEDVFEAPYDLVCQMRASICVLGPLLAKRGQAKVSFPGGCVIGSRPVDLHLKGLRALGADISVKEGYIYAETSGFKGTHIDLEGPMGSSVLATANTMMAATLAQGRTVIDGAAREPEVVDLGNFLSAIGGKIKGLGSSCIEVQGVSSLFGASYEIIPDRIEVGTLLLAGMITGGDVILESCAPAHMTSFLEYLSLLGQSVEVNDECMRLRSSGEWSSADFKTAPYPGFPTDLQAQMMTVLCQAQGRSIISEGIYPDRFMHVAELSRLGANIEYRLGKAIVNGPSQFTGTEVMSSDLRASAALILAALVAKGETVISRIYHLDRGYDGLEKKLAHLGGKIERVKEKTFSLS